MRYEYAPDLKEKAKEIITILGMNHILIDEIECIRSSGTSTRRTIARCHALGKVMQMGLKRKAFYVLEFIHERFDSLKPEDKLKTIIHELMHIPHSFGGGFKHHDEVNEHSVNKFYEEYIKRKFNEN